MCVLAWCKKVRKPGTNENAKVVRTLQGQGKASGFMGCTPCTAIHDSGLVLRGPSGLVFSLDVGQMDTLPGLSDTLLSIVLFCRCFLICCKPPLGSLVISGKPRESRLASRFTIIVVVVNR